MKVIVKDSRYRFRCPACHGWHTLGDAWTFNGDVEKPTFSPSILVNAGDDPNFAICHSFVEDGKIRFLNDCTHIHANKTMDLPDIDE